MQSVLLQAGPAPLILRPHARTVLQELASEDALVSFQGLRHRLGLHPQILSRTLRRLEEDGLAEEADGYRLSEAGRAAAESQTLEMETAMKMTLDVDVSVPVLIDALAGHRFGTLRWYGRADGPGETTLIWIGPAGKIRLRIRAGTISIEGGPADALLAALGKALARSRVTTSAP